MLLGVFDDRIRANLFVASLACHKNHRECMVIDQDVEGYESFEKYEERLDSVPVDCDQEAVM